MGTFALYGQNNTNLQRGEAKNVENSNSLRQILSSSEFLIKRRSQDFLIPKANETQVGERHQTKSKRHSMLDVMQNIKATSKQINPGDF